MIPHTHSSALPTFVRGLKPRLRLRRLTPELSNPGSFEIASPSFNAPFLLESEYFPAGDQPRAIEEITRAFMEGAKFQVLLGVTGSGKTFTMANIIRNLGKPALILTHNKTLAAQLYQEFRRFFPGNAVEHFVSYYDYFQPEAYLVHSDTFIDKDVSMNEEIDKLRLRATKNLLTRRDTIIISSVSCLYGLGSPADYFELMFQLVLGDECGRDVILQALLDLQYARRDNGFERGSFRVRGSSIEIHPSYEDFGFRIELFGDCIDKLYHIDLVSREIVRSVEEIIVAPAKHFVMRDENRERVVRKISKELNMQLLELREQKKYFEAERLGSRVLYDLELIKSTGFCPGVENYSRIIENRMPGTRPYTLLDYFGDDWLLIIDESHSSVPQVNGMCSGDRHRKTVLVDYGWRLPCSFDNRPMTFAEFEHSFPENVLFVSATPADYELAKAKGRVVEQINRPTGLLDPKVDVKPKAGQMLDIVLQARNCIENGDRVLITTLTKKMAQDLVDFFTENNLRARYLHSDIKTLDRQGIIKSLRRGEFDVLVGINLLREGLDLPEVALVVVMDADISGFLRNFRSLVQVIGRASRNVKGRVILYADKMTDAMVKAIYETKRRRDRQLEFNSRFGITPRNIDRRLEDILEVQDPPAKVREEKQSSLSLRELEQAMKDAAERLDFEEAAKLRDMIKKCRK